MTRDPAPRFIDDTGDYQGRPGSYAVSGAVVNCSHGSFLNTVRLVVEDRGSDMGGSAICMDVDTKPVNFSSTFGVCAKTGGACALTALNPAWTTLAKVPAYSRYEPIESALPDDGGTNQTAHLERVDYYPIVIESRLICWHMGSAGVITVHRNGQKPVHSRV